MKNVIFDLVDKIMMLKIYKISISFLKRYIHLTNNCIQIKDLDFHKTGIPGNMWDLSTF